MPREDTQFKVGQTSPNKGKKTGRVPKSAFKKGDAPWNKGKKTGSIPWNKGKTKKVKASCIMCMKRFEYNPKVQTGKYCSVKCSGIDRRGEKNVNWIGGCWLLVRKQILIEQDYTCQVCGLREPGIMEVNHKLEKSVYPELARDRNNLEVLCPNCHRRKTNLFLKNRTKNI
jgi:5-methylcytosine-specific restriction endonuclease McrA